MDSFLEKALCNFAQKGRNILQRAHMKILHLIYTNGVAGAEKYLINLLPSLGEFGYEAHLLIVCNPDTKDKLADYVEDVKKLGIPVKLLTSRRRHYLHCARNISTYMKENDISVIHSHLMNSDMIASLVKMFFMPGVQIISTKHGYSEDILNILSEGYDIKELKRRVRKDRYFIFSKFILKYIRNNYAVSNVIGQFFTDVGMVRSPMPVIHHGVNATDPVEPPGFYRVSPHQLVILGRLEVIKGHAYLFEAMPDVIREFPDCILQIVGEGAEKAALVALAEKLGISEHLQFIGFQHAPQGYVRDADVIILPSIFESFGLVYIEAFYQGTPVVAFETGPTKELMDDGVTGLLAPFRNSKALGEKIIYLLKNKDAADRIAAQAKEKYHLQFTTRRMAENTANYYKQVLR